MLPNRTKSVLLVVYNGAGTYNIRSKLEQIGVDDVEVSSDGAQALEMLREGRFALVICDWFVSSMTGPQFAERVRADPGLRHMPLIMIAVETHPEALSTALQAGVSQFLTVPFDTEALRRTVTRALTTGQ